MSERFTTFSNKNAPPEMAEEMRLNSLVAAKLLEILFDARKENDGAKMMENVMNCTGILCAQLIHFGMHFDKEHADRLKDSMGDDIATVLRGHIEHAVKLHAKT